MRVAVKFSPGEMFISLADFNYINLRKIKYYRVFDLTLICFQDLSFNEFWSSDKWTSDAEIATERRD